MRGVFLHSTKLGMYLTEIPIIFLMAAAIHFNSGAEGWVKLYPLIFVSGAAIVFIFVYLFRAVVITNEEIRSFGLFSSRDKATINKNKVLLMTLKPKKKVKIELFGEDDAPELDWMKDTERRCNVNLYRDVAIGGVESIRRVMKYFGFDSSEIRSLTNGNAEKIEIDGITATRADIDGITSYSLEFTKTI